MKGTIWSTIRKRMLGFRPPAADGVCAAFKDGAAATAGSCIRVRLVMGNKLSAISSQLSAKNVLAES